MNKENLDRIKEARKKKDELREVRKNQLIKKGDAIKQYAEIVGWIYANDKKFENTNKWRVEFLEYLQLTLGIDPILPFEL